jgi:hypothetical protein
VNFVQFGQPRRLLRAGDGAGEDDAQRRQAFDDQAERFKRTAQTCDEKHASYSVNQAVAVVSLRESLPAARILGHDDYVPASNGAFRKLDEFMHSPPAAARLRCNAPNNTDIQLGEDVPALRSAMTVANRVASFALGC